jgi:hypothetical protein
MGRPKKIKQETKVEQPVIAKDEVVKVEPSFSKACIFCGEHSNLTRFVNLQRVALCETHYYSETIGKVAQKIRERENAVA